MKRIIGIDPALTKTGWGVIEFQNNNIKYVASGTIKTEASQPIANRLHHMHKKLDEILKIYNPRDAAIEETFINNNPTSSLKLGHARGGLMLTLAINNIDVFEYSTTSIKKSVVGVGRAEKQQVCAMIKILLPQNKAQNEDEADALAAAICHINNNSNVSRNFYK